MKTKKEHTKTMEEARDIFEALEKDIQKSDLDEKIKSQMFRNLMQLKKQKLNILITGATGSGKSSTINALFDTEVAKVGVGADPETMEIEKYVFNNMVLWDSPGLGDGKEKDNQHAKAIIKKLNELDENGDPIIDLVLVILDGSTRDLGTSYELINNVIIPNLSEPEKRLLVAINQADVAMKGRRNWDYENNRPTKEAEKFLEEKVKSVKRRIKEATGVDIEPIYYAAGYKEENQKQRPYNLSKLLYLIISHMPKEKRIIIADKISKDEEMWRDNDTLIEYNEEISKTLWESIKDNILRIIGIGINTWRIFKLTGFKIDKVLRIFVKSGIKIIKNVFWFL